MSACYENLPAEQARAERLEGYYTPKAARWLNMMEIEFSAISRLYLKQRIPSQKELEAKVLALAKDRQEKPIKIKWQFSTRAARCKLNRHYTRVNPANLKPILT